MKEEDRFSEFFFDERKRPAGNPKQLNIHYPGVAAVVAKHFAGKKILEVGCGMGWITDHIQKAGEDCEGFDIYPYAVEKAICPRIFQGDMMDCGSWDRQWDVVFASNSMAYLTEDEIPIALKALHHIVADGGTLFLLFQTWNCFMVRNGVIPENFVFTRQQMGEFRRTAQTRDWWLERMFEAGFDVDWPKYKAIKFDNEGLPGGDFRGGGLGWRGLDNVFVLEKV